jgi:hypothetical protein
VIVRLICALLTVGLVGCLGPRTDGPIQPSARYTVGIPGGSEPKTWAMPISTDAGPLTIQRIDLLEVVGLDVLGIMTCEGSPWVGDSWLNCGPTGGSWPPEGVTMREVGGTTIGAAPSEAGAMLVGVKLLPGEHSGTISGVRIVYLYGGREFVVIEPWDLDLTAGPSST